MGERYIAFDVETPNSANDRMSAIGIAVVEDGEVLEEFDTLIDPETHFDPFNIALTGITPDRAAGQPTFPQLWREIAPLMGSGVLTAHNAPFDLSVLAKCLRHYRLPAPESVAYLCTCQMGRRLLPELPNHRLDTMCRRFAIPLDHHRAGSDSRAAAELLIRYLRSGADPGQFRRTYDLVHICTKKTPCRRSFR